MTLRDLVTENRSYRRFHQEKRVEMSTLEELIDLARLSASAANLQPLKYVICNEREKNALIFKHLGWAGYLKGWPGPEEGERPSAYIVALCDTSIAASPGCDHGIACQSILLGAQEKGFGGCMIGSVDRNGLRKALNIPRHLEILLVVALGVPKERVQIEEVGPDGDIRYWRDEKGVHHVPKRSINDLIVHTISGTQGAME